MSFLPLLIEFFLSSKRPTVTPSNMIARGIGYCLVILGLLIGGYQLFKVLFPDLGPEEAGLAVCGLLVVGGGILLFLGRSKPVANPMHDALESTTNTIKNLDIERFIHKNSVPMVVFALVAGLILSQLSHFKKLR